MPAALARWSETSLDCANPVVRMAISGRAPLVAVMHAAELRYRNDGSEFRRLHGSRFRRILGGNYDGAQSLLEGLF